MFRRLFLGVWFDLKQAVFRLAVLGGVVVVVGSWEGESLEGTDTVKGRWLRRTENGEWNADRWRLFGRRVEIDNKIDSVGG